MCFVAGCSAKPDQENVRLSFFHPPKDFVKSWEEKILKKGLKPSSRLCSRHFDDDDIIKGNIIGGVKYDYKFPRLKPGALPKHFLGK